jgi:hypothetical protein
MRTIRTVTYALLAAAALAGGPALANVCQAGRLICATTMPVGGYCQCTAHGNTEDGTVFARPPSKAPVNATAGGCGSQPNAPGCR